ncbi:MAG: metallopeptidase family protein [Candidatus Binatia bacterium]
MQRRRFRRLVEKTVDSLPATFRERMGNVEIVIEDEPTDEQIRSTGLDPEIETIFGLYEGTPLPERGHDYAMALPDRIILFYLPLIESFEDEHELAEEIRATVVHEVAHFFGMDDDEIEDLGY